jgi:hypothetical protein
MHVLLHACAALQGLTGVLDFLSNSSSFAEQPCLQLRLLVSPPQPQRSSSSIGSSIGSSSSSSSSSGFTNIVGVTAAAVRADQQAEQSRQLIGAAAPAAAVPVCWEDVAADAAAGECLVYSMRTLPAGWDQQQQQQQHDGLPAGSSSSSSSVAFGMELENIFRPELELATAGCHVHLITNRLVNLALTKEEMQQQVGKTQQAPKQQQQQQQQRVKGHPNITAHCFVLGQLKDPFAEPPVHTLHSLRQQLGHADTR